MTEIRDKDLNLLTVFEVLGEEQNLSKAAKRLHLSQPAVSHALARLRENFGDPLFVRAAKGMLPTPRATELLKEVTPLLHHARQLYASPGTFDPTTAKGSTVILTTDYFDFLALPKLIPFLQNSAPGIQLVTKIATTINPKSELEQGQCDLAIAGFFTELPDGFYKQTLFEETFSCVVRRHHPDYKPKWGLEEYAAKDHILISPQGDLCGVVDQALEQKGLKRKIVAGIAGFGTPGRVVQHSDVVLTAPTRIVKQYVELYDLVTVELPLALPSFNVSQVWHQRLNVDPMQRWMRAVVAQMFQAEMAG